MVSNEKFSLAADPKTRNKEGKKGRKKEGKKELPPECSKVLHIVQF